MRPVVDSFLGLRVTYIRNHRSVGPAASRNIGLCNSRTDFVAFTDNDVAVRPNWMTALLSHMKSAPPDVAGVGGRVVDDGTSTVGRYATRLGLLDPYVHRGRVVYLVTANCIFRRRTLIEVGGFDETFEVPGGEDPELCFRLLNAGYRLEHQPDAVVEHHYVKSWKGFYRLFLRYGGGCKRAMETLAAQLSSRTGAPGRLQGHSPISRE